MRMPAPNLEHENLFPPPKPPKIAQKPVFTFDPFKFYADQV